MRVYRDTRFSNNKLPYKTNIGIQFRHEQAKDVHSPGYYVHIEPDELFLGVGMWRPDSEPLRGIRERIAAKPAEWQRAIAQSGISGAISRWVASRLSRPPRGFDKEHECIDDIRRKSFIAVRQMNVEDCLRPQFQRTVESSFKSAEPFMRFSARRLASGFECLPELLAEALLGRVGPKCASIVPCKR